MKEKSENRTAPLRMARSFALECFEMDADPVPLPGEIDLNFLIKNKKGEDFVLKISRPEADLSYLQYQQDLLSFLDNNNSENLALPSPLPNKSGDLIGTPKDPEGQQRLVRLLKWIPGRLYSQVNPKTNRLRYSLGKVCGKVTTMLQGFAHPGSKRHFEWDLAHGL